LFRGHHATSELCLCVVACCSVQKGKHTLFCHVYVYVPTSGTFIRCERVVSSPRATSPSPSSPSPDLFRISSHRDSGVEESNAIFRSTPHDKHVQYDFLIRTNYVTLYILLLSSTTSLLVASGLRTYSVLVFGWVENIRQEKHPADFAGSAT
jgi:hypothetical protein